MMNQVKMCGKIFSLNGIVQWQQQCTTRQRTEMRTYFCQFSLTLRLLFHFTHHSQSIHIVPFRAKLIPFSHQSRRRCELLPFYMFFRFSQLLIVSLQSGDILSLFKYTDAHTHTAQTQSNQMASSSSAFSIFFYRLSLFANKHETQIGLYVNNCDLI